MAAGALGVLKLNVLAGLQSNHLLLGIGLEARDVELVVALCGEQHVDLVRCLLLLRD